MDIFRKLFSSAPPSIKMTSSNGTNSKSKPKSSTTSGSSGDSKDDKGKVVPSDATTEPPPSDPKEAWSERVDIITKEEHDEYVQFARDHIEEIILEVPKQSGVQTRGIVPLETGKLTVETNQDTDVSEYESADDVSVTSPLTSPKPERKNLPSSTSEEFFTVSSAARSSDDPALGNGQDTAPPSSSATPHRTATYGGVNDITSDEVFIVDVETNRTVTLIDQNGSFGTVPNGPVGWEADLFGVGVPVSTPKHNLLDTSHLTDFVQEAGGEYKPRRSSLFKVEGSPLIALSPVPQLKRPLFIAEEDEENDFAGDLTTPTDQPSGRPSLGNAGLNVTAPIQNGLNLTAPVIEAPESAPLNVTFEAGVEPTAVNKTFDSPASADATQVITTQEDGVAPLNQTFEAKDAVNQTFDAESAPVNQTFECQAPADDTAPVTTPLNSTESKSAPLNQTEGQGLEFSLRVDDSYGVGFVSAQSFAVSRINSEDLEATEYADVEKSVVKAEPTVPSAPEVSTEQTAVTVDSSKEQAVSAVSVEEKAVTVESSEKQAVNVVQVVGSAVTVEPLGEQAVSAVQAAESAVTVEPLEEQAVSAVQVAKSSVTVESSGEQAVSAVQVAEPAVTVESSEEQAVSAVQSAESAVTVECSGKQAVSANQTDESVTAVCQESVVEQPGLPEEQKEDGEVEQAVSGAETAVGVEETGAVSKPEAEVCDTVQAVRDAEEKASDEVVEAPVTNSEAESVQLQTEAHQVKEDLKGSLEPEVKASEPNPELVKESEALSAPSAGTSVNVDDIPLAPPSVADDLDDIPIPKKGYDLSFLDNLQDLENAVPDFQQPSGIKPPAKSAKTLKQRSIRPPKEVNEKVVNGDAVLEPPKVEAAPIVSAPVESENTEPKKEPPKRQIRRPPSRFVRPKPVPKTSEDVEILVPKNAQDQVEDTKPAEPTPTVEKTPLPKPSVEDTPLPKPSVEDTPLPNPSVDDLPLPKPSVESLDEDIPLPKKGYDLSFLDKLDDLENASPTSLSSVPKVAKPAKVQAKEAKVPVVPEVVASEPAKVGIQEEAVKPVVQVPVREQLVRSEFEDLTEKQKLDRIVAQQEESLAPSEEEILAQEAASVCEEIFNLSRHLEEEEMAEIGSPNRNTVSDSNINPVQSPLRKAELDTRTFKKPSARAPARKSVIPSERNEDCFSDPFKISSKVADDVIAIAVTSDEMKKLQEATANEQFVSGSVDLFADPSALDFLSEKGGRKRTVAKNSLYTKFDPIVSEALRAAPDGTENPPNPRASLVLFSPTKEGPMVQSTAPVAPRENVNAAEPAGDYIPGQKHREIVRTLELTYEDRLLQKQREIQELQKELELQRLKVAKAHETESQVQVIINEYESVITELTAKHENLRTESQHQIERLKEDLAISLEDLRKTERAFNDTMQKYERTKSAMEVLQANEEVLKNAVEQYNKQIELERQKMKLLKESFTEKCEQALANHKKELEAANLENTRLNALLKRAAMQTKQLEAQNEMLKKTNEELTSICDGLVAQMS